MKSRLLLLAACLLAGSLQAQGLFGGRAEEGQIPSRFIRIEGVAAGTGWPFIGHVSAGKLSCLLGKVRFGMTGLELHYTDLPPDGYVMPVSAGYTLWSRPVPSGLPASIPTYGMVPDIYAEATCSWLTTWGKLRPSLRAALCCDVDWLGVGVGLEAGLTWLYRTTTWPGPWDHVYAGLRIRAITFGIGF
jgi:hypothetical protein